MASCQELTKFGTMNRSDWQPETLICAVGFVPVLILVILLLTVLDEPYNGIVSLIAAVSLGIIQDRFMPKKISEVTTRSSLLGCLAALGLYTVLWKASIRSFGLYIVLLANFHWSEYLFVSIFCPHSLSKKSFILDHSPAYTFATVASWCEFLAWHWLFPGLHKQFVGLSWIGFLCCLVGESIRKASIATAGRSFNHIVEDKKRPEHVLVTHGIYAFCRHPSYLGWWIFAVATQIVLLNPICTVGFFYGAYRFFAARVPYEEYTLVQFFGSRYLEYRKRVPLLLPFIPDPARQDK